MSRMPVRLISSVRGIGVAVSVSTSTSALQLLDPLLVLHPEALLLVDHQQAEVVEAHVAVEQPVGADDDVDRAGAQPLHDLLGLGVGEEARQHLDPHRVGGEAVGEGLEVLLGEQRGRHEDRAPACRPGPP